MLRWEESVGFAGLQPSLNGLVWGTLVDGAMWQ
jgi:hypothetical protein